MAAPPPADRNRGKLGARRATNQLVRRTANPVEPREHGFHVQRLTVVRRTAQREVALAQVEVIRGAGLHQTQRLNEFERRSGKGGVGRVADAQDDRASGRVNDSAVTGVAVSRSSPRSRRSGARSYTNGTQYQVILEPLT